MKEVKETLMTDNAELIKRKAAFHVRTEMYMGMGLDRFAASEFVAKSGGLLAGPALDIGTGKGLMAMSLARQGLNVVSLDTDTSEQEVAVLLATEAGLRDHIQFVCGDASVLSFADNYFGCVAMMDVLHHLENSVPVLEEIARVLKPSGVLIIADFTPEGFELLSQVHQYEGGHPVSGVTMDTAESFLLKKGFHPMARLTKYKHEILVLVKNAGCQS